MEIRFVGDKKGQRRIMKACHVDPTSGHMGVKRTLSRISERFIWPGMVKDVNDTVRHATYNFLSFEERIIYAPSRIWRRSLHAWIVHAAYM